MDIKIIADTTISEEFPIFKADPSFHPPYEKKVLTTKKSKEKKISNMEEKKQEQIPNKSAKTRQKAQKELDLGKLTKA